ncbi:isochorismatase family protein [Paralimibaculum aggregatum]|uniref:Isochorismatase family protein n=1 Tax=Paralimibaculum aggregatum TaxID=3036245 RepID=A0ABQ6LPI2_9RHOB|nr:isochorismatase family protein [Limibaculum sp. NKW23]GMG82793.1 isochorismatase family protein [Limibaculum sp. NKW23]
MAHDAMDPSFRELIAEHAPVRQIGTGFTFTEGPIWHPREGHLLFSDMPADVRRRWDPAGGVREVMRPSNKGNGMTYDAELNLLVCEHSTSSVARFGPDGRREVLASHYGGRELNSPNDICVKSDGSIWFTDPTYGRMPGFGVERPTELGFQGVYRIPARGGAPELVVDRYLFTQPNGLCFSPDERLLYVNDTVQTNIRVFEIRADGRLAGGRVFASGIVDPLREGVPDGMKCDARGNVWLTAPGGLWVYAPSGRLIGKVSIPEKAANLHWGGKDWRTLFVCATHSVYAVQTLVGPRTEPFMRSGAPAATAAPAPARARTAAAAAPAAGGRIEAGRSALILQDLQNDVISAGGAFADSGSPLHARAQNVVENARRLAEACRSRGGLVIHVWFVCEPGHPAMLANAPLFEGLVGANALVRGSWGAAPVAGLEPQPGDLVVEKMTMSAWESGRLETYLRGAGRDTILNCGAWTNMSVEHTARTGADKGYRMIVPQDACSTMNANWQRASIDFAMANVAEIATVDEVIARLA